MATEGELSVGLHFLNPRAQLAGAHSEFESCPCKFLYQESELVPTLSPNSRNDPFECDQAKWVLCVAARRTFTFFHAKGGHSWRLQMASILVSLWNCMYSFTEAAWKRYPSEFSSKTRARMRLIKRLVTALPYCFAGPFLAWLCLAAAAGYSGYPRTAWELPRAFKISAIFVLSVITVPMSMAWALCLLIYYLIWAALLGLIMAVNLVSWLLFLVTWLVVGGLTFFLWHGSDNISLKIRLVSDIAVTATLKVVLGRSIKASGILVSNYSKTLRPGEDFDLDEVARVIALNAKEAEGNGHLYIGIKIDVISRGPLNKTQSFPVQSFIAAGFASKLPTVALETALQRSKSL